ncbi:MAG: hypothetical protein PHW92_11760 [Lutibacter sp.]|nr:hypothetical protein [Lutibacter sp.]
MSLPKKKIKKQLIELAKDNPLVSFLCKKVDISRATYYRWIIEDEVFKKEMHQSSKIGRDAICDLAESKIINLAKSGNENVSLRASQYILNNNSRAYRQNNFSYQRMKLEDKIRELSNENKRMNEEIINEIKVLIVSGKSKEYTIDK